MASRKYRQRGYQDDDRPEPRGRGAARQAPRPEGPRGRGLGAPTARAVRCAICGKQVEPPDASQFDAVCPHCGADLHTCTNCLQFEPSAPNQCRKPVAEPVRGKARNNQCELFDPKVTQEFAADAGRPSDPKAAFDALFKL